jgi:hypothetical protein
MIRTCINCRSVYLYQHLRVELGIVPQVQEQALVVLSSAYNTLSVDIAQQYLGLIPPDAASEQQASSQEAPSRALLDLLSCVAGRGSKRVGIALSKLQMDEAHGQLAFRA